MDIFKKIFDEVDSHQSNGWDYRLTKKEKLSKETSKMKQDKRKITVQIFELPLPESDRIEFIDVANKKFENILERIEHTHPKLVRKLWNPKEYIDEVLKPDILPIDKDYALSLVESFLIHHVIGLATEADERALHLN